MIKKILGISGIVAGVGILLILVGLVIVGFDFRKLDMDKDYTEKVYTVSDSEISAIKVATDLMKVNVRYREDDKNEIRIIYYENDKHNPTVINENGTIFLNDEYHEFNFFSGIVGVKRSSLETVVEIPKNNDKLKINIKTSNAKIKVSDISAKCITLKSSNGSIDINGNCTEDIYCETSNASINIDTINADNLTLQTSNGQCNAKNIISHNIDVKTSNGKIDIEYINSSVTNLKTSNGSIRVGDSISKSSFYAKTSNASITTSGIDSNKIKLDTSNGGINSTVLGKDTDYNIDSGTSNGKNNLENRGNNNADKSLIVYTSNASINVVFDDDYSVAKGLEEILNKRLNS